MHPSQDVRVEDTIQKQKIAFGKMSSGMTIRQALYLAKNLFDAVHIETSFLDAQTLLAFALKKTSLFLHLEPLRVLTAFECEEFFHLVSRRLLDEPVAYLVGEKEFFGHSFLVSNDCLIPRPDTEVIVEKCLELIDIDSSEEVIDLCCGSGAIGIALLKERPHLHCIATDISKKALALARKNARHLGVSTRLNLCHGDLFQGIIEPKTVKLVVTNPPYIETSQISSLPKCVRKYEPHVALDGGHNGLIFYEKIIERAAHFLLPQGYLVMEIGADQALDIKNLVGELWSSVLIFSDLAGRDRGIVLQKQ